VEVDSLKILGIRFKKTFNETSNYDTQVATINFMCRRNLIRNLNLLQKVWVTNTFILSKLWYVAKIISPGNQQIAKIKRIVGNLINKS
jgi:hypothetical protein